MKKLLFSGTATVQFQGSKVLTYQDTIEDSAIFQLVGFEGPRVRVIDSRIETREAIHDILKFGDVSTFPARVNLPAYVVVWEDQTNDLTIELHSTNETEPAFVLWAAIGMETSAPVYDYLLTRAVPYGAGHLAFLSVYQCADVSESVVFDAPVCA